MKVVDKGSVNISAGENKEPVLYKAADAEIAAFNVKPANGSSETDLELIEFILADKNGTAILNSENDVTVKINKVDADDCSLNASAKASNDEKFPNAAAKTVVTCTMNEKISSE
jgi:hypothetical protein